MRGLEDRASEPFDTSASQTTQDGQGSGRGKLLRSVLLR